ncbi:MAG: 30S ribosomal protein S9 [Candidatus Moranbacteria bacterium GW2011_GWF2_34_56]|nr:MAG: 30S ribosomal protein S9 [Candidatus Moranbacteria bacterium GW2011_GWF1_34_10]KKP64975.1 MAG: 30S ribosomal protein S9 [Candidatus Moranbacteria bacterium GW2011_GWF2_34_56]
MNKEKTTVKKVSTKKETAVKKTAVKKVAEKKSVKAPKESRYFYAVGRRKTSVAQVRITPSDTVSENDYVVNEREMKEYFPGTIMQATFVSPFKETGLVDRFKTSVVVKGGGISSQVEAIRLGIARALIKFDETLRPVLKANGFLTRDSRKVERKKPGLKKARRAPQWAKR